MRKLLAILACMATVVVFTMFRITYFGEKSNGILPMMVLMAILTFVWRAIVKPAPPKEEEPESSPESSDEYRP